MEEEVIGSGRGVGVIAMAALVHETRFENVVGHVGRVVDQVPDFRFAHVAVSGDASGYLGELVTCQFAHHLTVRLVE